VSKKQPGRPLKFGRPAQLLALTLPHDVVRALRRIHPDPAWAIVALHERVAGGANQLRRGPGPPVELARLSPGRSLIVVDPQLVQSATGVSVVPVAPGRAFLAFDQGRGLADLELGMVEQMQDPTTSAAVRKELRVLHQQIRRWRRSPRFRFSTRSIILIERVSRRRPRRRPREQSA
jgi:hypothetical protein